MTNLLDSVDSDWFNQRLSGVVLVISAAFVLLIVRLLYLQIIEGSEYRRLSEINSIRLQSIDAPRGLIFDHHGKLLVDNRPSFDLFITLKDAAPVEETLNKLSIYTSIPKPELKKQLEKKKRRAAYKPILIRSDIGRNALAAIEAHGYDLPGISVNVTPKRNYIFGKSLAHLLGYMGEIGADDLKKEAYKDCKSGDFIGKFGIEKLWEKKLRGKRGGRQVEVNASGRVVRVIKTVGAEPGRNLYLSIDHPLQTEAETLLEGQVGAVVAVDPSNGDILVMASSPSFDPNSFVSGLSHDDWKSLSSNPDRPMENKAVQAEYPPASTYKMISAAAGLEEGVIDRSTTYFCPGHYKFGNRTYRCWKKWGHGEVNVIKALEQSCDVFFYRVGKDLGVDKLAWYAKAFGLGSPTGIGLGHEGEGIVPTASWKKKRVGERWQKGETLSIVIGQGYNLATTLQMAMVTGAVGMEGTRQKPVLVKAVKTAEGDVEFVSQSEIVGRIPVKKETLDIVREGLWQVVNNNRGTAWKSRIDGVEMSGKTGTAQVVGRKEKTAGDDGKEKVKGPLPHAWFVAYAPAKNPKIAVAVIIEHGEHGSSAAAPVASKIVQSYLEREQKG